MGTYATTTSIGNILVNYLQSNTSSADAAGASVFSSHITRAEGFINSALARRYSLPFTTVPPIVITLTEDIACYYAIRATNYQDTKTKNQYLDEFKTAFDTLKEIADGNMALALTNGSLVSVNSTALIVSSSDGHTPVFQNDDPTNWDVSDTQAEAIADSRE